MKTMIDYALWFVGTPYIWGGDDAILGFDCSGFAQEVLASVGMDPKGDQTAHGLFQYFSLGGGTPGNRKAGSLAFYGKHERVGHVAIHIDSWRIVEAGGGNSRTKTANDAAKQNAYVRVRPYNYRSDYLISIFPRYPSEMKSG